MTDISAQIQQLRIEIDALKRAIETLAALPNAARPLQQQVAEKEQQLAALEASTAGAASAAPTIHSPSAARDLNIATNQTIYNYGAAGTPDRAVLLREYLLGLAGMCSRLSLADADSSDPARAAVELASVYTRLEVASAVSMRDERDRHRAGEQPRQLTTLEALANNQRMVLLGDRGGGKSTFVNFVGLCLSQAWLGATEWLEHLGAEWPHGALLPIRIVLREFAAWLAALPERPARGDAALLWDWLEHTSRSAPLVAWLRAEVSAGRALVLLDGFDEVPSDAQGQPLTLVREILTALKVAAGGSRMLITCRVLDYQQSTRQLPGWPSETLIPLSEELPGLAVPDGLSILTMGVA